MVSTRLLPPMPHWVAPDPGDTEVREVPTPASSDSVDATVVRPDPAATVVQVPTREPAAAPPTSLASTLEVEVENATDGGTVVAEAPPVSRSPGGAVVGEHLPATLEPVDLPAARLGRPHPIEERDTAPRARAVVLGRYLGDRKAPPVSLGIPAGASLEVGRAAGATFSDNPHVEAHHAILTATESGVIVEDLGSTNGVFVRLAGPHRLRNGDRFVVGEELLAFRTLGLPTRGGALPFGSPDPGYWGRIDVMLGPDVAAASYPIDEAEVTMGRGDGHIQFPDDPYASRQHCRIVDGPGGAVLEDLGSTHGTFVRLRSGDEVPHGSVLLIGRTVVRLDPAQ